MIILFPYQKLAVNFAIDKENIFIEAPTGSGKSVMISYLAQYYANQDKKVIVSTNTNQLALQLLEAIETFEFEDLKINKDIIDIVVGKNNYLDLEKIDLKIFAKFTDVKEVIKELSLLEKRNNNKEYLIDIFLDKLDIDEETKELLSKLLQTNRDKENIKDFEDLSISVTNHYYLIYKILFSKNELKDYVFIIDEVHQISDAMETIYTKTFSLYRFNYLLKKLIDDIKFLEFRGQKTILKKLFSLQSITNDLLKIIANEKFAGLSFIKDEKHMKNIHKIIKCLTKEDFLKLKQKLEKVILPVEQSKIKKFFIEEWNELVEISKVSLNEVGIYYSPAKGYPRLSITKKEYYLALKEFWKKIENIKGFSATLTIPNDDEYYKKRLNLLDKKVVYYQIPPVFKKEQINYTIVDKDFIKPNSSEDYVDIEWIKAIGNFVFNTYEKKNSLILMGSFLEVDTLFEYLNTLDIPVPILKAEKNKSVYRIIEKFKKDGGILVATRNYGVGIDLKGKLLEKLYIAKLPYPVMGSKKWVELKAQDKLKGTNLAYFLSVNEMLLNLKQWIGRLIRSPKDKGDLYILDSRVNKNNLRSRVTSLINTMFK